MIPIGRIYEMLDKTYNDNNVFFFNSDERKSLGSNVFNMGE